MVSIPQLSWAYPIASSGFPTTAPINVQTELTGAVEDGSLLWDAGGEITNQPGGLAIGILPTSFTSATYGTVPVASAQNVVTVRSKAGAQVVLVGAFTIYPTRLLVKRDGTIRIDWELNLQSGITA
jgi:hypothetical protein